MSVPQNANEVVKQLSKLSRELDESTQQLNEADVYAVNARESAKLAEAKAFLAAEGSVEARKNQARSSRPTNRAWLPRLPMLRCVA